MSKLKVGIIGLGSRGFSLLKEIILPIDTIEVTAVCDSYEDRAKEGADEVEKKYGHLPFFTTDAYEIIRNEQVEAVVISCAWESHIPLAIAAMKAGKAVGMEVGGAYSVQQCWDLVRTYEETKTPFMFLENCCF